MYKSSIYNGSFGFQGFVRHPINFPLSHKYPSTMLPHNSGIVNGMPPQFIEPLNSDMNSNARANFQRATFAKQKQFGDSSLRINALKSTQFKSNPSIPQSTKNVDRNLSKDALRRVRSGGTVPPPKKSIH